MSCRDPPLCSCCTGLAQPCCLRQLPSLPDADAARPAPFSLLNATARQASQEALHNLPMRTLETPGAAEPLMQKNKKKTNMQVNKKK